jgi:DNA topoisomerase-1
MFKNILENQVVCGQPAIIDAAVAGNTVSNCRKYYIHPSILDPYLNGTPAAGLKEDVQATLTDELAKPSPEEAAVLAFPQRRLGETVADDAR